VQTYLLICLFNFIYFVYLKMEKCKMQMFGIEQQNQIREQERGMSREERDARVSVANSCSRSFFKMFKRRVALELTHQTFWQCGVPGECPVSPHSSAISNLAPENDWGEMTIKEYDNGKARHDLAVQEELQKIEREQQIISYLDPERSCRVHVTLKEWKDMNLGKEELQKRQQKQEQERKQDQTNYAAREPQDTLDDINHAIDCINQINGAFERDQQLENVSAVNNILDPVKNQVITIHDARNALERLRGLFGELSARISRNQQEEEHQDQAEPIANEPELS
jgi:hypothetical protein